MKITNKFIHSGTRKFEYVQLAGGPRVGSEHINWPNVGVQVNFYVGNEELGEIRVRMDNDEADMMAIAILTQTASNRRNKAAYEAKKP